MSRVCNCDAETRLSKDDDVTWCAVVIFVEVGWWSQGPCWSQGPDWSQGPGWSQGPAETRLSRNDDVTWYSVVIFPEEGWWSKGPGGAFNVCPRRRPDLAFRPKVVPDTSCNANNTQLRAARLARSSGKGAPINKAKRDSVDRYTPSPPTQSCHNRVATRHCVEGRWGTDVNAARKSSNANTPNAISHLTSLTRDAPDIQVLGNCSSFP